MIVSQFTSALLEIEAPLPLSDDLFLIKLFAVSWRQVSPSWARRKSLMKIVEIACSSLGAVHRPISGKQFLEMSRFEVFAEDEVSVSHAPEDRGADLLLCSCHSRHISSLGLVVTAASLISRYFFAVPSGSVNGFFALVLSRGSSRACR